jgi:5'-nucleotidase
MIGGMPRIAHLIRQFRRQDPNLLVIDAGDIFQGTPYFKFYHGQTEVEMLNQAGYDLYTIGNHEFDDGPSNLATQLKNAKFDILSCNIDASACPQLARLIRPAEVRTIKGQRVGFIGAITPDLEHVSLRTEAVKVIQADNDWTAPIRHEIEKMKAAGVNKIVLVTHTGIERDRELAQLPEVDAIIGGHSHTRLDEAVVVERQDGSHCIIVQTGCYGRALGKLDLAFTADGKVDLDNSHYRLINITDRIYQEKEIARYLRKKARPFLAMRRDVVAIAETDFDNAFKRYPGDSPLGDLITDALAEAAQPYGATVALHNRGGIRSRIDKGPITQEKVEELLPFENHLIVATVSGADLQRALENSVSGGLGAKFLDVHGLRFQWDPTKPPGQRVRDILVADNAGQLRPWRSDADYRVAINSYSFNGGEGYDFSHARDVVDTGKRLSIYFHDYLLKHKHVQAQSPARIVPLASIPSEPAPHASLRN